jgi:histidyl-tRNA synthetase
VYLVSESGPEEALVAASVLRRAGLRVDFDTEGRSVKAQFRAAVRSAEAVVVLKQVGEEVEVRFGGERAGIPLDGVAGWLQGRLR